MDINRDTLKEYFERGDRPTEEQFVDLIDSLINKEDDQVHVVGSFPTVQIGLGTAPDESITSGPGLLRLFVDQRTSTKELKIRGDGQGGPNTPGPGKLLFATDATGNSIWRDCFARLRLFSLLDPLLPRGFSVSVRIDAFPASLPCC